MSVISSHPQCFDASAHLSKKDWVAPAGAAKEEYQQESIFLFSPHFPTTTAALHCIRTVPVPYLCREKGSTIRCPRQLLNLSTELTSWLSTGWRGVNKRPTVGQRESFSRPSCRRGFRGSLDRGDRYLLGLVQVSDTAVRSSPLTMYPKNVTFAVFLFHFIVYLGGGFSRKIFAVFASFRRLAFCL